MYIFGNLEDNESEKTKLNSRMKTLKIGVLILVRNFAINISC